MDAKTNLFCLKKFKVKNEKFNLKRPLTSTKGPSENNGTSSKKPYVMNGRIKLLRAEYAAHTRADLASCITARQVFYHYKVA